MLTSSFLVSINWENFHDNKGVEEDNWKVKNNMDWPVKQVVPTWPREEREWSREAMHLQTEEIKTELSKGDKLEIEQQIQSSRQLWNRVVKSENPPSRARS